MTPRKTDTTIADVTERMYIGQLLALLAIVTGKRSRVRTVYCKRTRAHMQLRMRAMAADSRAAISFLRDCSVRIDW